MTRAGSVAGALSLVAALTLTASGWVPISASTAEHRAGIVRVDPGTGTWFVLSNTAHVPAGVTAVSCSPSTGALTVSIAPVRSISTFLVGVDETYARAFTVGASAGLDRLILFVYRDGAAVACDDPALRLAGSNIQVSLWGSAI